MTMSEAAEIVLSENNRPMSARELVKEIESRGLFKFGARNPASILSRTLSNKTEVFTKTAPSTYKLK